MKIPKAGNILIPNIDKKIEEKLKEFKLTPEITPQQFLAIHKNGKHRYFSICKNESGKKMAFYSRLHFNLDAKNKITEEIRFLKKLKKSNLKIKKIVPQLIDYGIEKDFEWFIRECPPGKPLGQSRTLEQKIEKRVIPKLIEIVFQILKIQPNFLSNLRKFEIKNYLPEKIYRILIKEKFLERERANSIQNFIKKNFMLLKKENRYFCHGDLNLGNIISNGKNFFLIDWELIHINNFAYDIGYLWSHLWQAKKEIRQALIFEYLKKLSPEKLKKFKILFPIVASFLALGGIRFKEEKKSLAKKRKSFYSAVYKNFFDFEKLIKL
ncbi:MAG: phosphotransferase [Minisyncoccales bacterium]